MKEKIDQYAKGIFEYCLPEVVVNPSELSVSVDAGEITQGSFMVQNSRGRIMKGIVCTDCAQMILEKESFQGTENEIAFAFRGTYCRPGDVIRGEIRILSDCGVGNLPFTVTVAVPSCETSAGRIRDLNQFTELVKGHYIEALRIFQSPSFERIFLWDKETYLERYKGLLKGNDKSMALEEFLIAAHKKTPVQLTVEKRELQYPKCEKIFADQLVLHKDTWGYGEYEVKTDASFLRPERSCIRTTDFTGDTYELPFVINPDCMAIGHNFARITISSVRQVLEIKVIARKYCLSDEERRQRIQQQKAVWNLYRSFLYFEAGKISRKDYIELAGRSVGSLDEASEQKAGPCIPDPSGTAGAERRKLSSGDDRTGKQAAGASGTGTAALLFLLLSDAFMETGGSREGRSIVRDQGMLSERTQSLADPLVFVENGRQLPDLIQTAGCHSWAA